MPVVSSGDLDLLRDEHHRSDIRLSFLVPPILWEARVDDATIVKGETSIDFNAGTGSFFSMIEAIQEVWIGSALRSDDVGRLRIKSISSGDGGVTGTVTVAGHSHQLQDNQYLTFKHDYPLKPRISYIEAVNPDTDLWYMDDDITYSNQNTLSNPVVIAGPHRAGFLDATTGEWAINVDASGSYAMTGSISTYALSVASTADTAVVNFNTGTGIGDITFDTPGYYWAKYTVTDSNGKSQVSYRLYIAHDQDRTVGINPFIDCAQVVLENSWDTGGWMASLVAEDEYDLSTLPDHTLTILWGETVYGGTAKNITFLPDQTSTIFAGYVRSDQDAMDWAEGVGEVDLVMSTIEGVMLKIFSFSTSLKADQSANKWFLGKSTQKPIDIIHNFWRWRSTLYEVCDVLWETDNTLMRIYQAMDNGNLYDNANTFMYEECTRSRVICDQGGRIHVVPDQQLLTDTERGSLVTIFDITKLPATGDYGGPVVLPRTPEFEAPFVTANGMYWDGGFDGDGKPDADEFCSIAPGGKPLWRGADPVDKPKQTISSQDHLNKICGRYEAKINNPTKEIRFELHGNYTGVFDCAYGEQYETDLQASENPRGITWSNKPLYLRHVQSNYDSLLGIWNVSVSFEPEHITTDGIYTECPSFPPLGGFVPPTIDPLAIPGALLTGASVNYRGAQVETWVQRLVQDVKDLIQDPFWRTKTSSVSPDNAITFRCGVGYIKRSTDAFKSVDVDITPGTNPPNDAGDTPAPTATGVTYIMADGSPVTQNRFTFLVNWENSSNEWRSWILYTGDNGSTWSWAYLGDAAPVTCTNPAMTKYNITGINEFDKFGGMIGIEFMIEVDTDKFVVIYTENTEDLGFGTGDPDGAVYVQAFSVNPSTEVVTWGTRVRISVGQDRPYGTGRGQVCKVSTNKFVAVYQGWATSGPSEDEVLMSTVCTLAGLVITAGTSQRVLTDDELALYAPGSPYVFPPRPHCPDASTIILASRHPMPTALCAKPDTSGTQTQYTLLEGAISGLLITWDDVSCNGDTYRDWIQMESDTGSAANSFNRIVKSGSSNWIWAYEHADDDEVYVRAGAGTTFGSRVAVPGTPTFLLYIPDLSLLELDNTHAVFVWGYEDSGTSYTDIYANVITRTGTAVSIGSAQLLYSGTVANPDANDFEVIAISSTQFAIDCNGADSDDDCASLFRCSVSGNTITVLDSCIKHTYMYPWAVGWSSTHYIILADWDYSSSTTPYVAVFQHTPVQCSGAGTGDARGLGISLGKSAGTSVWITLSDGADLELLEVSIPGLSISSRLGLGNATESQVDVKTYIAYPFVPYGYDDAVYVFGRMNDPQSLGNPAHVIRTLNGGASFSLIEGGWAFDHCGSLTITTAGYMFAVRNQTDSKAKLYRDAADNNLALKLTFPFDAQVAPHGMAVDMLSGNVYVCSWLADPKMVVKIESPYLIYWDITFNHDNTDGVESIIIL